MDARPSPAFPQARFLRQQLERLDNGYEKARHALIAGMVTRAVYSRAQLLERMVEFWLDHFNVASDGIKLDYVIFQREAIQKNALGKYGDLLLVTAQSPAMHYYLDNYLNVAEAPNENYAREVMGFDTLGVDLRGFHGIEEGLQVLGILAEYPCTAQRICRKLCVRFVSDQPPDSLVAALKATWMNTGGQIKPVLRQLFLFPEFAVAEGQKLRRGLDFATGAIRTAGTDVNVFYDLESMLDGLAGYRTTGIRRTAIRT